MFSHSQNMFDVVFCSYRIEFNSIYRLHEAATCVEKSCLGVTGLSSDKFSLGVNMLTPTQTH